MTGLVVVWALEQTRTAASTSVMREMECILTMFDWRFAALGTRDLRSTSNEVSFLNETVGVKTEGRTKRGCKR